MIIIIINFTAPKICCFEEPKNHRLPNNAENLIHASVKWSQLLSATKKYIIIIMINFRAPEIGCIEEPKNHSLPHIAEKPDSRMSKVVEIIFCHKKIYNNNYDKF